MKEIELYMRNSANHVVGRTTLHKRSRPRPADSWGDMTHGGKRKGALRGGQVRREGGAREGRPIPFYRLLDRIEQLLGREMSDDEERRVASAFAGIGWLYSYDRKRGKTSMKVEELNWLENRAHRRADAAK